MPGDCGIQVVESSGARHERLAGAAFLRRTAVEADRALDTRGHQIVPQRDRGRLDWETFRYTWVLMKLSMFLTLVPVKVSAAMAMTEINETIRAYSISA